MKVECDAFWGALALNRASTVTLSAQLADAIADAVEDGVLAPGAALPSQLELAEKLGVSARVPREAFRRLAAQGVAVARPRLGCVILPRRRSVSRGRAVSHG